MAALAAPDGNDQTLAGAGMSLQKLANDRQADLGLIDERQQVGIRNGVERAQGDLHGGCHAKPVIRVVQQPNGQGFQHGGDVVGAMPQDNGHFREVSTQKRLQDLFDDRAGAKRKQGFQLPHAARFSGGQHHPCNAHRST